MIIQRIDAMEKVLKMDHDKAFVAELMTTNETYRRRLEFAEKGSEIARRVTASVRGDLSSAESIGELVAAHEEEITFARAQIESQKSEIIALTWKNDHIRREEEGYLGRLEQSRSEAEEIREKNTTLAESKSGLERAVELLQRQMCDSQARLKAAQEDIDRHERENKQFKSQILELELQVQSLNRQNTSLRRTTQQQNETLEATIEQHTAQIANLREQSQQDDEEYERVIARLRDQETRTSTISGLYQSLNSSFTEVRVL